MRAAGEAPEASLRSLRRGIDRIDARLLDLLDRRMELALRTTGLKDRVRDPEREERILSQLTRRAGRSKRLSSGFVARLFGVIFGESRRIQARSRKEVHP